MNSEQVPGETSSNSPLSFLAGGGEMGALIRAHDWSATPLGRPEAWPQSLKTAVRIMLTSRQPIWIGWGPELIYLYNDAYLSIIGGKHPRALGRPTSEAWREIWPDVAPMLAKAMEGIEGTYVEEQLLVIDRYGYAEETYYTFSYSPIPGDDGAPGGIICANTDDTRRIIGDRQLKLLRELTAQTADARSWGTACERSMNVLASDPHDLMFALLYVVPPGGEQATLGAAHGVAPGHPAAPQSHGADSDTPWPIAGALRDAETGVVVDLTPLFGEEAPIGAWDRPSTRAAVLAMPASRETGHSVVLVAGLNPYRLFDEDYHAFLRQTCAQVAAAVANADAYEEERRSAEASRRYLMTQDRLSLALSTGRVAVFEWSVDSDVLAIQGPLAQIFGVPSDDAQAGLPLAVFLEAINPDDLDRVMAILNRSVETGGPYEAEYRVNGLGEERVVVARGNIVVEADGRKRMSGVVIDITAEKRASATLREQTRALEILNRAGAAISGDLDQDRLVQTITDAAVELTGAQFGAFFYNVEDDQGERYTLYTLSGAPREAFSRFPMPRNTHVFGPTFAGTEVVRSDDITQDPRYGRMAPHHGMPKGHLPVRSYLAVPVKSRTGEVLGGLFFGHSDCGVFNEVSEDRIVGLAGQAAVAMDNARLFQSAERELAQRRVAEAELQTLNATLEDRVASEVVERSKAEEALRQAQKMEAVGQLTGGVAHDFNNLLTVIIGGLDTIKRSKPGDDARIARAVDMALQGAQRAASLTERLLAFSRRQPLSPKALELNGLVRDMTDLLHRTLGEQIELEGVLAPRLWRIEADQNQLESALLNLAVNARDAMPQGGRLTIETANAALDETYAASDSEVIPGQYVMVSVSDTGVGMSRETLGRVFEPFFTTKEVGRGTGLGLSMVYGFVKQSGGHVTIYSEEGQGTSVKLYFPRYLGGVEAPGDATAGLVPTSSDSEVVLVVEDNEDVRAYSTMILGELGYQVIEAEEAEAALAILRTDQQVDLLFTDVVLPGKSGRVLADAAAELRPGIKVLFTTGYSRNAIVHQGRLDAGVQVVTKPFTFEQLAGRVRDVLDSKSV